MRTTLAIVAALGLLGGCASTSPHQLPRYQAPPADAPAAELFYAGLHGRASLIDGAETPVMAKSARRSEGVHRVAVDCSFTEVKYVAPVVLPRSLLQHVVITGSFLAGHRYYVHCALDDRQPHTWIADSPDGQALPPGFEAVCTRSCETWQPWES